MKVMKLKKKLTFAILMCMMFGCVACGDSGEKESTKEKVMYEDDNVTIKEVGILDESKIVMSEWVETDVKKEIKNSDAIIKCRIDDIKEITISTTYLDTNVTAYRTLLSVKIGEVLYDGNSGLKEGDVVKVSVCSSSYEYSDDIVPFVKDMDYYLLLNKTDSIKDDMLQIGKIAEYYINSPVQDIIALIDNDCIVSDLGDESIKVERLIDYYNMKTDSASGNNKIVSDSDKVDKLVKGTRINEANTILNMLGRKKVLSEKVFLEFVDGSMK
jgi:hypothetical protein